MGLVVSEGLVDGGLVVVKVSNFGWIRSVRVSQVMTMIGNHGAGLSCGISLRRGKIPLWLA